MPMRPCLDVTIWGASPWCWSLCAYSSLFRSVRWYAYHACLCHSLASCASLHACLHVHAWDLLASVLSMLQHNEAMDIQSKLAFVPRGHHLLFNLLLVCLFTYLFTSLFLCLPCLSCLSALCPFHRHFASFPSIACLLVTCLCLCMYTHGARMLRARAQSPKRKQKGCVRLNLFNMCWLYSVSNLLII